MSDTHSDAAEAQSNPEQPAKAEWSCGDVQSKVATVGVILVGAALIETALIPGMVVGVAAALAPKYAPKLVDSVRPAFRSIVRGAYKFGRKAREAAAEAQEQVQDIVAEVHAEDAHAAPKA
jgi:hypothetical protein